LCVLCTLRAASKRGKVSFVFDIHQTFIEKWQLPSKLTFYLLYLISTVPQKLFYFCLPWMHLYFLHTATWSIYILFMISVYMVRPYVLWVG